MMSAPLSNWLYLLVVFCVRINHHIIIPNCCVKNLPTVFVFTQDNIFTQSMQHNSPIIESYWLTGFITSSFNKFSFPQKRTNK